MSPRIIEYRAVVQRGNADRAIVAMASAGCRQSGHGGMALSPDRLTLPALLAYLFPAVAMLAGALIGMSSGNNNAATALGAAAGFVASLVVARIAIGLAPGLSPTPQLISHSALAAPFPQE